MSFERVEIGDAVLYRGDCLEILPTVPGGQFDLAIVDPPYGISAGKMNMGDGYYGKGRKDRLSQGSGKLKTRALQIMKSEWDEKPPGPEYFMELFRASKNQIIWGGNYFPLPPSRCVVCWDKCQPWPNFSAWEMAWTSFDYPAKLFRYNNAIAGKIHPTQKPAALYSWLLSIFAQPGAKILDTHLGSGSSALAALAGGYKFEGYEKEQAYFDAACKRIEAAQKQGKLFQPERRKPEQRRLIA